MSCHFFGGSGGDDTAAAFATPEAKVNQVVGAFDDIEVEMGSLLPVKHKKPFHSRFSTAC